MPEVVSTIGTGQTFENLSAWADDITSNGEALYSTDDIAVAEVDEDLGGSGDVVSFGAANITSPISKAIIRPTSGNAHDGDIAAGFHLQTTTAGAEVVECSTSCDYPVDVEDLILRNANAAATSAGYIVAQFCTSQMTIRRCIIQGEGGSAVATGAWSQSATKPVDLIRCMFVGLGTAAKDCFGDVSNCSIDDCTTGIDARDGEYTLAQNNIVMNCTTCYMGTFKTGTDKNMSSDATAPGATNYQSETRADIWTDPDSDDWTLKAGTNAKGNGDDLGTGKEQNVDIENDTVSGSWDLGAYHAAAASIVPGVPCTDEIRAIYST